MCLTLSDLVGRGGNSKSFEMLKTEVSLSFFYINRTKWLGVNVPMPENGLVLDNKRQNGFLNDLESRLSMLNKPFFDGLKNLTGRPIMEDAAGMA